MKLSGVRWAAIQCVNRASISRGENQNTTASAAPSSYGCNSSNSSSCSNMEGKKKTRTKRKKIILRYHQRQPAICSWSSRRLWPMSRVPFVCQRIMPARIYLHWDYIVRVRYILFFLRCAFFNVLVLFCFILSFFLLASCSVCSFGNTEHNRRLCPLIPSLMDKFSAFQQICSFNFR